MRLPHPAKYAKIQCADFATVNPLADCHSASTMISSNHHHLILYFTPPHCLQVVTNTAIEEVLHLLPPVKVLRVVLVGPEFKVITRGPKVFSHFDKEVCPPCSRIGGIKRIITIYRWDTGRAPREHCYE